MKKKKALRQFLKTQPDEEDGVAVRAREPLEARQLLAVDVVDVGKEQLARAELPSAIGADALELVAHEVAVAVVAVEVGLETDRGLVHLAAVRARVRLGRLLRVLADDVGAVEAGEDRGAALEAHPLLLRRLVRVRPHVALQGLLAGESYRE